MINWADLIYLLIIQNKKKKLNYIFKITSLTFRTSISFVDESPHSLTNESSIASCNARNPLDK